MSEKPSFSLPLYLECAGISTEKSNSESLQLLNKVREFTKLHFGLLTKFKDFIEAFHKFFPAKTSYPTGTNSRFDFELLADGKIACNMAALVFGCWLETSKPAWKPYYFVKRGRRLNHAMIGVVKSKDENTQKLWEQIETRGISIGAGTHPDDEEKIRFYRLTDLEGFNEITDDKDLLLVIGEVRKTDGEINPKRGYIFQDTLALTEYLIKDKKYRSDFGSEP